MGKTGPKPRIDWLKAERLYVQNPAISYRGVAAKVGVSNQAVVKHAKDCDWLAKRDRYMTRLRTAAEDQAEKDGPKLVQQTEKDIREVGAKLLAKVCRALDKLPDEEVQKWALTQGPLREAAKVLMLLCGLPTERSQVEQTKTGLEDVSDEELDAVIRELRQRVPASSYRSEDDTP